MKRLLMLVFLSGCSYQLPGIGGESCTAEHGGDPRRCWTALHLDKSRPAMGSSYHSAGTMSLAHATCVKANSQWWFHGAHHPVTKEISWEGNDVLRSAYSKRYPAVVDYLDRHGSLSTTRWTKLSGLDLNKLGVPICSNTSN